MKVIKILLIEDDRLVTTAIITALKPILDKFPEGEVLTATTMRRAQEIALEAPEPVDIVILDLSLPDSTREESLASIPRFLDRSPVLIVTGWPDVTLEATVTNAGAGYLNKNAMSGKSLFAKIVQTMQTWGASSARIRSIEGKLRILERMLTDAPETG